MSQDKARPRPAPVPVPTPTPTDVRPYEAYRPYDGGEDLTLRESSLFHDGRGPVWETLRRITSRLDDENIPYAVIGGMALIAHGYRRETTDIDMVMTAEARRRAHEVLGGRGFLPPFEGSRNLRDTTNGVKVDLVRAGDYAGTDDVKPIAFPDPTSAPLFVKEGVRYVTLETLMELKLASGMSNPGRTKDLGDVQSTIGALRLPRTFGERLHAWVQPTWYELWDAWDHAPRKDRF